MAGRPDSLPDLATIDVPTAVVVGDSDPICTLDNAKTMHDGITGATLTVIKGAGHLASPRAARAARRGRERAAPAGGNLTRPVTGLATRQGSRMVQYLAIWANLARSL